MFRVTITEIRKDVTNVLRALKFKFKQLRIFYKKKKKKDLHIFPPFQWAQKVIFCPGDILLKFIRVIPTDNLTQK